MATFTGATDANGFYLQVTYSESALSVSNDTSTLTASSVLKHANSNMFSGWTLTTYLKFTYSVDGGATIDSTISSSHKQYSMPGTSLAIDSGSASILHDNLGAQSVTITAFVDADSNASYVPLNTTASATISLTDLSRPPLAPSAAPTITRNRSSIGITSAVPSAYPQSPVPTTSYRYRYDDNSSFTSPTVVAISSGRSASLTGTTPETVYYVQTQGVNSEGNGAWSETSVAYAAPSISSVTSVATTATVVVAKPSSNGGSNITQLYLQYSLSSSFASGNTTASLTVTAASTSGTFTVTGLTPGNTWYFRAYYVNNAGFTSPNSASSNKFISAYGRRCVTKPITDVAPNDGVYPTYTSDNHGFTVGDPISVVNINPYTLNSRGTVYATTTNTFTVANFDDPVVGLYSSGGYAAAFRRITSAKRYDAATSQWVDVSIAQYRSGTSWVSIS